MTPENSKYRVLVVDGVSLTRFALISLINLAPRTIVEEEAATVSIARSICARIKPDVIVLDIEISCGAGIDLIGEFRKLHPLHTTVVVTWQEEIQLIQRAFAAGANAYISKLDEAGEICIAIESVLSGRMYMSPRISQRMLEDMAGAGLSRSGQCLSRLSNRELHVFRLLGIEKGASEIARELGVSVKTIETHQQRIKEKLHLKTAHDLHLAAERWSTRMKTKTPARQG